MDFTNHDNFINTIIPFVKTYQSNRIKSLPVFLQLLNTHSTVPKENTIPDRLSLKIPNKLSDPNWLDAGLLSTSTAIPVSIDTTEYVAPTGTGWIIRFYASDGFTDYVKSVGFGVNEVNDTIDWRPLKRY